MKTSLVKATSNDAELLKSISVQAFTSDFQLYGSYPPGIASLDWHKSEIEKGHYYKIVYDDEITGGLCVIPSSNNEIEIKYFFIADTFQNKRIGSTTMMLIEDRYKDFKTWNLVTPYKAIRNHHFYEKLGYSKIGEVQPESNNPFKVYEYRKEIAE